MTYPAANAYIKNPYSSHSSGGSSSSNSGEKSKRILQIVCTLRGSKHDPSRLRIQQWIREYAVSRRIPRELVVSHEGKYSDI